MNSEILNTISDKLNNLVIDDEQSINYQKSSISNKSDVPAIDSIAELNELFNEKSFDIFKYDTKKCISLILDDDSEISLHEFKSGMNPIFIKLNDKCLEKSNPIILPLHHKYFESDLFAWSSAAEQIQNISYLDVFYIRYNFGGFDNCQRILNILKNQNIAVPAIEYCSSQKIENKKLVYQGYLLSYAEMCFIYFYRKLTRFILKYLKKNGAIIDTVNLIKTNTSYWTSNEYSAEEAWIFKNNSYTVDKKTLKKHIIQAYKQI